MSRLLGIRLMVSIFVCIAFASAAQAGSKGNDNNVTGSVNKKTSEGVDSTDQTCKSMKQKLKDAVARGKERGSKAIEAACVLADERLGTKLSRKHGIENNPQPARVIIDEPKDDEILEIKAPFDVPKDPKPTGSAPITRNTRVTSEKIDLGDGQPTEMISVDLSEEAWLEWLSSDDAQLYGTGALAIITIAGVSYVLYKNRVPQRIAGYVVKNPVKSLIATACVVGLAAYIASERGIMFGTAPA